MSSIFVRLRFSHIYIFPSLLGSFTFVKRSFDMFFRHWLITYFRKIGSYMGIEKTECYISSLPILFSRVFVFSSLLGSLPLKKNFWYVLQVLNHNLFQKDWILLYWFGLQIFLPGFLNYIFYFTIFLCLLVWIIQCGMWYNCWWYDFFPKANVSAVFPMLKFDFCSCWVCSWYFF